MTTILIDTDTRAPLPCVATVGMFDGVHRGHQHLISRLRAAGEAEGLPTTVVTFARHPRQVLQPDWRPQLLTTPDEKRRRLELLGVDRLAVLRFSRQMAALSGRDFMRQMLRDGLGVRVLYMGYDNRFGHDRADGFDDFCRYGRELGISVRRGDALAEGGVNVSSSYVRQCLLAGDAATAARCLGRPYQLSGVVVRGKHVGTGLGFPTANLQADDALKLVPAPGAYATRVWLDGEPQPRQAMTNIGSRPTFGGQEVTMESHIFGISGELYGHRLTIGFVSRLRPEQRFESPEALARQLHRDARQAQDILNNETTSI